MGPQILINRERLKGELRFDVELLGDGDHIIDEISRRIDDRIPEITETDDIDQVSDDKYFAVKMGDDCENTSYIFRGAERIFQDKARVAGESKSSDEDDHKPENGAHDEEPESETKNDGAKNECAASATTN